MNSNYVSPILEKVRNTDLAAPLQLAEKYALQYIENVNQMRVYPQQSDIENLSFFDAPMPELPMSSEEILAKLHTYGSPATVAQTGGRYFGFVCGGILPSALCSKWLTDAWDQNPAMFVLSPVAAKLETVCEKWLKEIFGLPNETICGFVSGSSTAIVGGLLAGRNYLLEKQGHSASKFGLKNAPQIKVVLSEAAHSTVYKAISILGIGVENVIKVSADEQGRICADKLPPIDDKTLLILQAGNVNSGAFDDFKAICPMARKAGAWVHIDGAFGLWASASNTFSNLTMSMDLADSWSADGHKTLNAPYDNGILLCRHKETLINSMHMTGGYIQLTEGMRDSMMYTMEMSRRARAADLYATLCGLGKIGVAELVDELHYKAVYFAEELRKIDFEICNDVVFNQVIVRYKSDELTKLLVENIQNSGVFWLGGSIWFKKYVARISMCSYKTTYSDIDACVNEIKRQCNHL